MKLSIVATLYRSSGMIEEFCRRALATAETLSSDVELVLVNDGSPDDSVERAVKLHGADPRIVVVDLSRNFGHHKAIMTGLSHVRGDLVFLIDSDLEEEPELLPQFLDRLSQGDCDVVYGVQAKRRSGRIDKWPGEFFWFLARTLSNVKLPRNILTARLMTRQYVQQLVRHRDREFMLAGLFELTGFRQVPLAVNKHSFGPTTYRIKRRLEMGIRYITTTSTSLLYWILYLGVVISTISALVLAFLFGRYLMGGTIEGWTSVIASIWLFGGSTTLILGLIGIYVSDIHSETKRRPYTIVRKVYRSNAVAPQATMPEALRLVRSVPGS
jgi:putative glycosyltransferase